MMGTNSEPNSSSQSGADPDAYIHSAQKEWAWGVGHKVGKFMRGYLKGEAKVFQWAAGHGVPQIFCRIVLLSLKLMFLATFLYTSFWLAIYATACWIFVKMAELDLIPDGMEEPQDGWRVGHSGYGDYIGEYRVDPGRFDRQE